VSWRVDREAMLLAGGTCALLLQIAHPAVAAGVAQHSAFREDAFGRLRRTLHSSMSVVFDPEEQALRSIRRINAVHRRVAGVIPETGQPYDARDPELLFWVHATLVDTALRIHDRFVAPLSASDAEAYHAEAKRVAVLLGVPAARLPATVADLRAEMAGLIARGTVSVSPTARMLSRSVLYPTRFPPRFLWDLGHLISVSLLPPSIRRGYGLAWNPARERAVRRVAWLTRHTLPLLPDAVRAMPQARSAERRVRTPR
jgi:uncharacterized protein (DUF2236 family)